MARNKILVLGICYYLIWIITFNTCNSAVPDELSELVKLGNLNLAPWRCQEATLKYSLCTRDEILTEDCNVVESVIRRITTNNRQKNVIAKILLNSTCESVEKNKTDFSKYSFWADSIIHDFLIQAAFCDKNGLYSFLSRVIQSQKVSNIGELKLEILNQLRNVLTCNNNLLQPSTQAWVFSNLIFPLIPQMDDSVSIYSSDFAYAMAGIIFIKSCRLNLGNVSNEELIQLATGVQYFGESENSDKATLKIFGIPALFHYTNNHIDNNTIQIDFANKLFKWHVAYKEMVQDFIYYENTTYSEYEFAMSAYHNRSELAASIIKAYCTDYDLEDAIASYKNKGSSYQCENSIHSFPDVTKLFEDQNEFIASKYRKLEIMLITKTLRYNADYAIISKSTVKRAQISKTKIDSIIAYHTGMMSETHDPRLDYLLDETVDLFEVNVTNYNKLKYYALLRENGTMYVLSYDENNPEDFYKNIMKNALRDKVVSLNDSFTLRPVREILKNCNQNIFNLADAIAAARADNLRESLYRRGYIETGWELTKRIFFSFVPFHNCYKEIVTSKYSSAWFDCTLDVLTLIPFFGQITGLGLDIFEKAAFAAIRVSAFKSTAYASIRAVIKEISLATASTFTKTTMKNLGISLLRAFDPGFEMAFTLSKSIILYMSSVGNLFPIFGRIVASLKQGFKKIIQNFKLESEIKVILASNKEVNINKELEVLNMQDSNSFCKRQVLLKRMVVREVPHSTAIAGISPAHMLTDVYPHCTIDEIERILENYLFENRRVAYDFAFEFSNTRRLPQWALNLRIRFPELIRGIEIIQPLITPAHITSVRNSVKIMYTQEELQRIDINIDNDKFIQQYNFHQETSEHILPFEDYFAIRHFGNTGLNRINYDVNDGMHMRDALRRLTIRQTMRLRREIVIEGYAVFQIEDIKNDMFSELQTMVDNVLTKQFTPLNTKYGAVEDDLEELEEGMTNVIVRMHIDSEWAVADLRHILLDQFVLHPNVPLRVEDVEVIDDYDIPYLLVTVSNDVIEKENFILEMMNDIEGELPPNVTHLEYNA